MADFHKGYSRFCSAKGVSQELSPLLSAVYNHIHESPVNLTLLKKSLINLMSFLSQCKYHTDKNCHAVNLFFAIEDHWNARWDNLPEEFRLILDDIAMCLHDTVSAPNIAKNFDSTPERLLKRIEQLKI